MRRVCCETTTSLNEEDTVLLDRISSLTLHNGRSNGTKAEDSRLLVDLVLVIWRIRGNVEHEHIQTVEKLRFVERAAKRLARLNI